MDHGGFYLGGEVDPASGDRTVTDIVYDPSDLTTHGVIVGMTGSGKTGLGILFLEEALRSGVPTLVVDPKGDMTNLLLTFPDLAPADFEPWVQVSSGESRADVAAKTAGTWSEGLASWGLDGGDIQALKDSAGFAIYTPGSTAGQPVNIVGSLAAPDADWDENEEALRDEISSFASGLLALADLDTDPITSREHILIANLIEHAWKMGVDLDLVDLLRQIQQPPMRKLGVFEIDEFFPAKERSALAMKLNALVASPSFSAWLEGADLDPAHMLWDESGNPCAAIVYLAHLDDAERQFAVTLLLSRLITWMRSQSGSSELRALVYMDEVFGFVPPTAEPPAKRPILTLLKQARAYGVGMLLSTQNPVDLDYKAMSNTGTWCIGRLQTERDKARIVEALQSARGDVDVAALDETISGLGKRHFVMHNVHEQRPAVFTTRWALSYLAGPLTKDQVKTLEADEVERGPRTAPAPVEPDPAPTVDDAEPAATTMPPVAEGVTVHHVDPAATWVKALGLEASPGTYFPALAVRVHMVFDDASSGTDHREEWEAIYHPLTDPFDAASGVTVDQDDRDFIAAPPPGAVYEASPASINTKAYFREARTRIKNYLDRNRTIAIYRNRDLKLWGRIGESKTDFLARCDEAGRERADAEAAKLRDKYTSRIDRIRRELAAEEDKIIRLDSEVSARRQDEIMDQAGAVIGVLLGRRSTRSITGSKRTRDATRSTSRRLEAARAKADSKVRELEELEHELLGELEDINDRWEERSDTIETVEIGLEKDDIDIAEVALVWLPGATQ